jgi:environmental stress-induced protein Ves
MDRKNLRNIEGRPWSGGTTREIYRDQEDFNLRISSAVIDPGASRFSDYSGYRRILKVLEGEVHLRRQEEVVKLDREGVLLFGGEEDISSESSSSVLDFNVIFREDRVKPTYMEVREKTTLITRDMVFLLSLEEESKVEFKGSCSTLDRYDLLLLREEDEKHMELIGNFIVVTWKI